MATQPCGERGIGEIGKSRGVLGATIEPLRHLQSAVARSVNNGVYWAEGTYASAAHWNLAQAGARTRSSCRVLDDGDPYLFGRQTLWKHDVLLGVGGSD